MNHSLAGGKEASGGTVLGPRHLLLSWAVFAAFLTAIATYEAGGEGGPAVTYGVVMGAGMSLLSWGLWILTHRAPWQSGSSLRSIAVVSLGGLGFSLFLQAYFRLTTVLRFNRPFRETVFAGPFPFWEIVTWSFFGSALLAVMYSLRGHEQAHFHRMEAAEAKARASAAKLDTLRGQLNPHFLYNALHSINVLATHNPTDAQQAISDLGDILRYALASDDEWEVPLAEEWAFTKQYLALERIRFADRLDVGTHLADDALAEPVPRFILQPLVENAIRHGVSKQPGGGTVEIQAFINDTSLELVVENDGNLDDVEVGSSVDTHDDVQPEAPPASRHSPTRTGIRNLRERLSLSDRRSALTLETRPPGRVRATLTLALEQEP